MNATRTLNCVAMALALLASSSSFASGSGNNEEILAKGGFILPGGVIEKLVTAPRHLNVTLNNVGPDGEHYLVRTRPSLVKFADLSKPYYNLGGFQVDIQATRARSITVSSSTSLDVYDWKTKQRWAVQLPDGATSTGESFSPDGKTIAFFANFADASYLYVADTATGKVRRLNKRPLMATNVTSPEWTDGGKALMAVFRPDRMPAPPNEPSLNDVPFIERTDPRNNELRVFFSLLQSPQDDALYEYYMTGQLAKVSLDGKLTEIGTPKMVRSIDSNPSGGAVRVTTVVKPFSRIVQPSSFGFVEEVWDGTGKTLAELSKREIQLGGDTVVEQQEQMAFWLENAGYSAEQARGGGRFGGGGQAGSAGDGKRAIAWRPDGAGLSYLQREPADKENPNAPRKDRVMLWKAPFGEKDVETVYATSDSIGSLSYSADCRTLFISTTRGGNSVLYAVNLEGDQKLQEVYSYKTGPDVDPPGTLVTTTNANGSRVVRMSGNKVWLQGTQNSPKPLENAPRPFLKEVTLGGGEPKIVWQSAEDTYETLNDIVTDDASQIVINRESPTLLPDSWLLNVASGEKTKLTNNKDYTPEMTETIKERFRVKRPDGFSFWVSVTLPKTWTKDKPLPAFFWFYPSEFTDQASYDRADARYNKNRWVSYGPQSKEFFTQLGYAVVAPDCPIVGKAGMMNNNYVNDLLHNLSTTIDELVKRGMVDREKLAIGGHSYGAFSTANALVHTPFFKAGIAGDGNYNRTLTPTRFQNEQRLLMDAREVYEDMSPILYADHMTGALLMYHSMTDQNVGTNPVHAKNMYLVLESIGKDAALYMYPHEDHGQRAQETVLDMWSRWVAWLDKYVMNAGAPPPADKKEGGGQ